MAPDLQDRTGAPAQTGKQRGGASRFTRELAAALGVGAQTAEQRGETPPRPHVVITVHGIRTFGDWQKGLKALLEAQEPGVQVYNYTYGYFSLIAFFIPLVRWLVTLIFREELRHIARRHPGARMDLVAHSFGTHLVGWALLGLPKDQRPRVHTLVLAGSVLKVNFSWRVLMDDGSVRRVINDCGIEDSVLILNQLCVLFTGMAGRVGFNGATFVEKDKDGKYRDGRCFVNRFFRFGHGGYFARGGADSEDFVFMRTWWVPLLTSGECPEAVDEGRPTGAWYGAKVFLLNNTEPVKLTVYAALLLLPARYYYRLWTKAEESAEKERAAAAREKERFRLAWDTLEPILARVGRGLSAGSRGERVPRQLLVEARHFFEKVAQGPAEGAEEQALAGRAWSRLGDVHQLLGELGPARAAYDRAVEAQEHLAREQLGASEHTRELARALHHRGAALQAGGRWEEAEADLRRARELRGRLAKGPPEEPAHRQALALTDVALGRLYEATKRRAMARAAYGQALSSFQRLVRQSARAPEAGVYEMDLAETYLRLGMLDELDGQLPSAEKRYGEAIAVLERLAATPPGVREHREELCAALYLRVAVRQHLPDYSGMEADIRRYLRMTRELGQDYPHSEGYQLALKSGYQLLKNLAAQLLEHGGNAELAGEAKAAEQAYRRAAALLKEVLPHLPDEVRARKDLAMALGTLGYFLERSKRDGDADRAYGEARSALLPGTGGRTKADAKRRTALAEVQAELAGRHSRAAEAFAYAGDAVREERSHRRAAAWMEELVKEFSEVDGYRRGLAAARIDLGNFCARRPDREREAEAEYLRARDALRPLRDAGKRARAQAQWNSLEQGLLGLCRAHRLRANEAHDKGQLKDAVNSHREVTRLFEVLIRDFPEAPEYLLDLGDAHSALALVHHRAGEWEDAASSLRQASAAVVRLIKVRPKVALYHWKLGMFHFNLAEALSQAEKLPPARAELKVAVKHFAAARELEPKNLHHLVNLRASYERLLLLLDAKDYAEAAAVAAECAKALPEDPAGQHLAAGALARAAGLAAKDKNLSECERDEQAGCLGGQALACLRTAVEKEYALSGRLAGFRHPKEDAQFEPLHKLPGWQKLLADLEARERKATKPPPAPPE